MKSVVKKKDTKDNKAKGKTAQCCAKTSKNIPGCHD